MITFDKEQHSYTHNSTKEKYISVTTLLSKYKPKFDKDKHSLRVAEREGVSQELILEMWEAKNTAAKERGTITHKLFEDYFNGDKSNEEHPLIQSYIKQSEAILPRYNNLHSELLLYNEQYKVAGTADIIYEARDYFVVGDFKTNERFDVYNRFNGSLLAPVNHLDESHFNTYALQMSLYAFMYENTTGKPCKMLVLYYIKDNEIIPYYVNYLKSDIINILNDYTQKNITERIIISNE